MKIHKVKDCFCGCSLESGSNTIAWMQLIIGEIMMFSLLSSMTDLKKVNRSTIDCDAQPLKTCEMSDYAIYMAFICMLTLKFLSGLFLVMLGMILFIGVAYSRLRLISIWIVLSSTELFLYPFFALLDVYFGIMFNRYILLELGLCAVLISSTIMLKYYCIVVVESFRKQIMSESNTV